MPRKTSCICEAINKIPQGSFIQLYIKSGQDSLFLIYSGLIKNNCIVGKLVISKETIIIDCENVSAFEVLRSLTLAPADCLPLPSNPPLITSMFFIARTNPGQTSSLCFKYPDGSLASFFIDEELDWGSVTTENPAPSTEWSVCNCGGSPILIYYFIVA